MQTMKSPTKMVLFALTCPLLFVSTFALSSTSVLSVFAEPSVSVAVWPEWASGCAAKTTLAAVTKRYLLLGERDSGTNLLEKLIPANFAAVADQSTFKHMYANVNELRPTLTRAMDEAPRGVILVVRRPEEWMMAMYDSHHEIDAMVNNHSFAEFLVARPWRSVIPSNSHVLEVHDDIFELRRAKLALFEALLDHAAPANASSDVLLIHFESLATTRGQFASMCAVHDVLSLPFRKANGEYVSAEARSWLSKGESVDQKTRTYFADGPVARAAFCTRTDWEIEHRFGYSPPDFCTAAAALHRARAELAEPIRPEATRRTAGGSSTRARQLSTLS